MYNVKAHKLDDDFDVIHAVQRFLKDCIDGDFPQDPMKLLSARDVMIIRASKLLSAIDNMKLMNES